MRWSDRAAQRYKQDPVLTAAAAYIQNRGGLTDDQRDDILGMVALTYAAHPEPIQNPEHWGRAVAHRRVLEFRRQNSPVSVIDDVEDKLILSNSALRLATLRQALAEYGEVDLETIMSWGQAAKIPAFARRHHTHPPRRIAIMALLAGHWPKSADHDKHTPANVIEDVCRNVKKSLKRSPSPSPI